MEPPFKRMMVASVALLAIIPATIFINGVTQNNEQGQTITTSNQDQHVFVPKTKQQHAPLDIKADEKVTLRKMLASKPKLDDTDFERLVWVKDIVHTIRPWVSDPVEAESIAQSVYMNSKLVKLSPELVLSVIAVESAFDHFAISNVGAVGLMQIMPFWKKELGQPSDNLLQIETNVRYGCVILRHYINHHRNLDRALGAYNGSLGRMKYPNLVYARMKRFKAINQRL